MQIEFEIPGEPSGKARARSGNGHHYTPAHTVAYENLVKTMAAPLLAKPHEGAVAVHIAAHYGMPKSMSKGKRQLATVGLARPMKKPDADNVAKIVCDALNKIAYVDDSQVVSLTVEKWYSDRPRVTVSMIFHG